MVVELLVCPLLCGATLPQEDASVDEAQKKGDDIRQVLFCEVVVSDRNKEFVKGITGRSRSIWALRALSPPQAAVKATEYDAAESAQDRMLNADVLTASSTSNLVHSSGAIGLLPK